MSASENVNPRYANYARFHHRTIEEQREQDRKDWPGGRWSASSNGTGPC